QWGVHGDDVVGLELEGLVGVVVARAAGTLAGEAPGPEALGVTAGVQDVRECLRSSALPVGAQRSAVGVPLVGLESVSVGLLSSAGRVTVLKVALVKSECGCSDPCWHPELLSRKESGP